jgi:hypothetical protein
MDAAGRALDELADRLLCQLLEQGLLVSPRKLRASLEVFRGLYGFGDGRLFSTEQLDPDTGEAGPNTGGTSS